MRVQAPQSRDLRRLVEQRGGEPDEQRLPPRAPEVVAQVHAQGHQQQHVEEGLVDVGVAQQARPGGGVRERGRGAVRDELDEVERHELRVRRIGHHGRAVLRQRQDDHVIGHEHIEHERVHDERAQPGDGAELAVLVDHIGQRDGEGDQREGHKAEHDVAGVDAHGTGSPWGSGAQGPCAGRVRTAHVTIIGDGVRAAPRAIASTLRLRGFSAPRPGSCGSERSSAWERASGPASSPSGARRRLLRLRLGP